MALSRTTTRYPCDWSSRGEAPNGKPCPTIAPEGSGQSATSRDKELAPLKGLPREG
jgi:hypothetical protein